jgi:phage shock protein PspC (stress-responsive transcriptional regulator)
MQKTLTANIGGTVFHLEEDGYERMQRYLDGIRGQLAGTEGRDEIMADIEHRIGELLHERLAGKRQVVTLDDVDHVMGVMGRPEDYAEGSGDGPSAQARPSGGERRYKRLFRDPDDKWVGGVIGGLGAYAGMDPIWLRVIMILLILLGKGTPILLYLILWMLVPPAESAADRLMMEGEPVTVDNLKRAFEEGGRRVANEAEELGKRWKREAKRQQAEARQRHEGSYRRYRESARSNAAAAARGIGRAFSAIAGLLLLLLGTLLGMAVVGTFAGSGAAVLDGFGNDVHVGPFAIGQLLFASGEAATWFVISLAVLLIIPVIALFVSGARLLLDVRPPSWIGWTLGPLWFAALFGVAFIGLRTAGDFGQHVPVRSIEPLPLGSARTLTVDVLGNDSLHHSFSYKHYRLRLNDSGLYLKDDSVHGAWAALDVATSPDSLFHLVVERAAQARTSKDAQGRALAIRASFALEDSTLRLSPWVSWPRTDLFRVQRVRYVVQVPMGAAIRFAPAAVRMLDDVQNTSNTPDSGMGGLLWRMTPQGLHCPEAPSNGPKPRPEPEEDDESHRDWTSRLLDRRAPQFPSVLDLLRLPG